MTDRLMKRVENEKKFPAWEETVQGRKYYLTINCRQACYARYVNEVDYEEDTVRFYEEVYDEHGRLVEVHNRYPVDEGHRKVEG